MKVLLLHALPLDERMWETQLDTLAEYEVEAPNLYALGGSSMDAWAATLVERVPDELVLVGASMGGYLALAITRLAPERVQGLVLAGSRADADSPERKAGREAALERIEREGAEGMWLQMEPVVAGETVSAELRERLRAIALEQPPDGLASAVRAIRDRPDSTGVVAGLAAPFLIVVGDHDPIAPPEYARKLAAVAPDGEAVVFDGVGHLPNLERPAEFDAKLLEFLRRVG
ncbi:MAG TPA: alpha/beta fold hydrolase [Gaiellaceae bacterium]